MRPKLSPLGWPACLSKSDCAPLLLARISARLVLSGLVLSGLSSSCCVARLHEEFRFLPMCRCVTMQRAGGRGGGAAARCEERRGGGCEHWAFCTCRGPEAGSLTSRRLPPGCTPGTQHRHTRAYARGDRRHHNSITVGWLQIPPETDPSDSAVFVAAVGRFPWEEIDGDESLRWAHAVEAAVTPPPPPLPPRSAFLHGEKSRSRF